MFIFATLLMTLCVCVCLCAGSLISSLPVLDPEEGNLISRGFSLAGGDWLISTHTQYQHSCTLCCVCETNPSTHCCYLRRRRDVKQSVRIMSLACEDIYVNIVLHNTHTLCFFCCTPCLRVRVNTSTHFGVCVCVCGCKWSRCWLRSSLQTSRESCGLQLASREEQKSVTETWRQTLGWRGRNSSWVLLGVLSAAWQLQTAKPCNNALVSGRSSS